MPLSADTAAEDTRRRFRPEALEDFGAAVLAAAGMPAEDARLVARRLITADLRGFGTHGIASVPRYALAMTDGRMKARPDVRTERRGPWAFAVDADNGLGHVVAARTMETLIDTARTAGIGMATVRNTNHVGMVSLDPLSAAENRLIGVSMTVASPNVAPWGSSKPLFGTNPLAVAAPAGRHPPFVFDMATSAAARLKVKQYLEVGRSMPEGWAIDADGRPTTDPAAGLEGALLPVGGAKGSGLSMVIEILAGVLSGSAFGGEARDLYSNLDRPADSGNFLMALDPAVFMPFDEFAARMDTLIDRINALEPAPGFDAVRVPGQRGVRLEAELRRDGIPLRPAVVDALEESGRTYGVPFPD